MGSPEASYKSPRAAVLLSIARQELGGDASSPTGLFEHVSAVVVGPFDKMTTEEVTGLLRLGGAAVVELPPAPQRLPAVEGNLQRVVFISSSAPAWGAMRAGVVAQVWGEVCLDPMWILDSVSALRALPTQRFIVPLGHR